MVPRAGIEPAFSSLRTKRDRHYSNGACARRPGLEPGAVSLEGCCAVLLRQRRWVGRPGLEPGIRGLKVRCIGHCASGPSGAYPDGLFNTHTCLLVGRARLERAHLFLIRGLPSPFGHRPVRSERVDRTPGLRLMKPSLLPTELSRRRVDRLRTPHLAAMPADQFRHPPLSRPPWTRTTILARIRGAL